MLLWVLLAVLTGAAVLAVLLPLGRTPREPAADHGHDSLVYRDQLEELERERDAGLIGAEEAAAARTEIARRLIEAESAPSKAAKTADPAWRRRAVALIGLIGVPLLAGGLYLSNGAPDLPGQPLAARMQAPQGGEIETLVARVEDHLGRNPEDGQGWQVLAPIYVRLGRPEDAAQAYRNVIRLLGSSADRQAGLGEAIYLAEGGIVTAEARQAFEAAKAADARAPKPRFFLALAYEQAGEGEKAAAELKALLADSPPDAPWRPAIEQAIARVSGQPAPDQRAPTAEAGPSREQVAAAADMSGEERDAMIEGMVARLAERLAADPSDTEGWLRLIKAYAVLGRQEEASGAAQDALASAPDGEARQRIVSAARQLGLAIEETANP
ncbi:c-type cytochrome biogenesis protein CcmI [Faunimonas sp. B44]|uniref:c-type cytochrome biogenesis protein CcmI n=1 Tax=Faunimonas sp. B44 TaxID=3461493 RepID=UPI004043E73D